MVTALSEIASKVRPIGCEWQRLPPRMRVLFVAARARTGIWLSEALASDSASEVIFEEVVGSAAGMVRLRDEQFDAVLVGHEPGELDALDLVEGYRTGGAEEPIIILGRQPEQEMAALCYEVGADAYVAVHSTTRNLLWVVARAVQHHQLVRENHRIRLCEQAMLQREQAEAACLIEQQQTMLDGSGDSTPDMPLPIELVAHYRELLRTYVIMGSGNLAEELSGLAELLVTAGLSARQVLQLHLSVLRELVQGLGSRSARHVTNRADLLAIEILMHLADGYQTRYQERIHPPVQQMLPGF